MDPESLLDTDAIPPQSPAAESIKAEPLTERVEILVPNRRRNKNRLVCLFIRN
jgi:hypothetical protein